MAASDRPSTRLVHLGAADGPIPRTVGPPVVRGSTVLIDRALGLYDDSRPTYGRGGLSTHEALTSALCELEGATAVRLFPSGLAAVVGAML
ncbi:MAG: PLP-dependent transferase, partial [Caulobacteraceae bacterium]|nr:PLP-dependent transferase [Caulobacteraceae bacterium]